MHTTDSFLLYSIITFQMEDRIPCPISWDQIMPLIHKISRKAWTEQSIPNHIYEPFVIDVQEACLSNDIHKAVNACLSVIDWQYMVLNSQKTP